MTNKTFTIEQFYNLLDQETCKCFLKSMDYYEINKQLKIDKKDRTEEFEIEVCLNRSYSFIAYILLANINFYEDDSIKKDSIIDKKYMIDIIKDIAENKDEVIERMLKQSNLVKINFDKDFVIKHFLISCIMLKENIEKF